MTTEAKQEDQKSVWNMFGFALISSLSIIGFFVLIAWMVKLGIIVPFECHPI